MLARCDRCGANIQDMWSKGDLELRLCGHHSSQHSPALVGDGWTVATVEVAPETKGAFT
jgi:hypothetical protein